MSWTTQGYLFGRPETDYGNGDPNPAIDERNEHVPAGIKGLSIYYGCSGAEFFRGVFDGSEAQARAALERVRQLTVYACKYWGMCTLADHLSHLVFIEQSDERTWFFDAVEQPRDWKLVVEHFLPPKLRGAVELHARPDPSV
jgi:hypothetical protein